MTGPFDALRGEAPAERYSARDVMRPSRNPACGALPLMEAAGVRPDTAARMAHDLGLGPDPHHGMSNIARQQGDTWDETLFADGRPLLDALVRDDYLPDHDVDLINISDHVDPTRAADGTPAARGGRTRDKEQRERERVTYNRARARITTGVVTAAVAADRPTLMLRSVLEATAILGSAIPTFLELDFALIIPEGRRIPGPEPARIFGDGPVIIIGDGKSWRRLGRLDNGDKRAEAARLGGSGRGRRNPAGRRRHLRRRHGPDHCAKIPQISSRPCRDSRIMEVACSARDVLPFQVLFLPRPITGAVATAHILCKCDTSLKAHPDQAQPGWHR